MIKSKLNILMITSRADFGGGPEHVYRLIRLLNDKVNFFIACPHDYPYFNLYKEIAGSDNIIEIPHRKFTISALLKLSGFIGSKNIDIIHSHGKGAGIYGRLLSFLTFRKCIHTFHGIHIDNYNYIQKIFYLWIERFLSLLTERFISVSDSEAETAVRLNIARKEKIQIIPNGTYIPEKKSGFNHANSKTFDIITITRFDYAKNSLLLIPICKELTKLNKNKNIRFVVIGSGEEEEELKREIADNNYENLFYLPGFVLNPGEYLINSFCYISTSRWEGLPLGVLEAMSYGLPVIATNVNGNKDIIENNANGFLFDINNPAEAAKYIMQLVDDSEKYKDLSGNGRKLILNKYSLNKMADETHKIYLGIKN